MATVVGPATPHPIGAALGGGISQGMQMNYMNKQWNKFLDWYSQNQAGGQQPTEPTVPQANGSPQTPAAPDGKPGGLGGMAFNMGAGVKSVGQKIGDILGGSKQPPPPPMMAAPGMMRQGAAPPQMNPMMGVGPMMGMSPMLQFGFPGIPFANQMMMQRLMQQRMGGM